MTATTFALTDPVRFTINRIAAGKVEPIGRPLGYVQPAGKLYAVAALMQAKSDGTMARKIAGYEWNCEPRAQALVQAAESLRELAQRCRKARWAGQPVPSLGDAYFHERRPAPGDDGSGLLWSQSVTPLILLCEAHQAAVRTGLDAAGADKARETFDDISALFALSAQYPSVPPSMEQAAGAQGYTPAEYLLDAAAWCVSALSEQFNMATGARALEFKRAAHTAELLATSARAVIVQGVEYTLQGRGVSLAPTR